MRVLACNSPYGRGGIGQHFAQVVEESREADMLANYFTPGPASEDPKGAFVQTPSWLHKLIRYTPLRFSPGWHSFLYSAYFDWAVSKRLASAPSASETSRYMGFAGEAYRSFLAAREAGFETLELISPTSHVHNVQRLHREATQRHRIGTSWLHDALARRTLREYEAADLIYVHSEYTRQSFVQEGISEDKLQRMYLPVHPRFQPPKERPTDDAFRIVYVGRVDVTKGLPLLLEAFSELDVQAKELILVGSWSSRSMRRYMQKWLDRGLNITVAPGDPLPSLQQADVFVHPTYEDGYGYAPMEALACGVPVIATQDTGMKEYIQPGTNGFIVPTGSADAILSRLQSLYASPLCTTRPLIPSELGPHYSTLDA